MDLGRLRASPTHIVPARNAAAVRRALPVAIFLLAAGAAPLFGQASVSLETESREAFVNEPFTVSIRVDNYTRCDSPQFPDITGAKVRAIEGVNEQESAHTFNGRTRVSRSRIYNYQVIALETGELVIPPVKVAVDGRTVQTESVRIAVKNSNAAQLFWAEITCDRQRIYVGQRVRPVMTIWVKPAQLQGYRLSAQDMMIFMRAVNFGPFPVKGIQVDSRQPDRPELASETYYTYQTWTDYVPDRPGLLNFDQVEVGLQYPTRLTRDLFGRLEASAYRMMRATPKPLDVSVLPLPTNGRPANFTGAVGTFNLTVLAEPTAVRVGDPIKLIIEIRGDGPLETLPPPNLADDPKLTDGFRVPREELAGEVVGGRKRFTQIIRADRPDITEIPRLEYPYFDPDRELYAVALSDPIPLKVIPAAELSASALVDRNDPTPGNGQSALHALDGLRGNETRESRLLAGASPVSLNALAWATFAPPAAYLAVWAGLAYATGGGSVRHRRQRALRQARSRITAARQRPPREAAADITAALAGYLAGRLGQPAARFIGPSAVAFLVERNVSPTVRESWQNLAERCEQASFGGLLGDTPVSLAASAQECLRALDRERL